MFIYVMDIESRDYLIAHGYNLLKDNGNSEGTVWVFANKEDCQFDTLDIPCVVSDTLTF
ncbi:MAG: hypothetical protein IKI94_01530 [Ruminococcus sp.]|nr:hypothetical protein [Ruminococcus sp.]